MPQTRVKFVWMSRT